MKLKERTLDRRAIGIEERGERRGWPGRRVPLSIQRREGDWLGELGADTTLESDYIFYLSGTRSHGSDRQARESDSRSSVVRRGLEHLSGGPAELNASVKAYFALKLAGDGRRHDPTWSAPARRCSSSAASNGPTRSSASISRCSGQIDWTRFPSVPPELAPAASMASAEHLRDVVLDADDRRPPRRSCRPTSRFGGPGARRIDELFRDVPPTDRGVERDRTV